MIPNKTTKIQAQGIIFTYNKHNSIAYRTNTVSKNYLIFLDGLTGNILSIPYFKILKQYCDTNNITLVYPQLRSHPKFYTNLIDDDLQDINSLIEYLEEDSKIVLMGNSTGCQDCLLYVKQYGRKNEKIQGIILQAPVSDVQANTIENVKEKIIQAKNSQEKFYVVGNYPFLRQRFITLNQQNNKQDLFSSYLPDSEFQKFSKCAPIQIVLSLKDQYCGKDLSHKFKHMGDVEVLPEGNHQLHRQEDQKQLIKIIDRFLKKIKFI